MKKLEKFLKGLLLDLRGVTPVVGVILMVAVTVVMGAVVAGFVYGYVGTTQKGPLVGISVVDDPAATGGSFLIKHTGGETISAGDWKISVTLNQDSSTKPIFASAGETDSSPGGILDTDDATINAGKTVKAYFQTQTSGGLVSSDNSTAVRIATSGLPQWYHVVITHAPSNSLLLDTNVQVR